MIRKKKASLVKKLVWRGARVGKAVSMAPVTIGDLIVAAFDAADQKIERATEMLCSRELARRFHVRLMVE
jgi:hypothetical protein